MLILLGQGTSGTGNDGYSNGSQTGSQGYILMDHIVEVAIVRATKTYGGGGTVCEDESGAAYFS